MQQTAKPHSTHTNTATQAQPIIIIALIIFTISGLISGFAYGAFSKPRDPVVINKDNGKNNNQGPVKENTPKPTATATPSPLDLGLGCPTIEYTTETAADGAIVYSMASQILDKSKEKKTSCGQGKPFYDPKLLCKIWITKDAEYPKAQLGGEIIKASSEDQKALKGFTKPFSKEEAGGLVMEAGSSQVQPCSSTGKTSWKYRISPALGPGTYTIVVIASWDATLINWSWYAANVPKK